MHTQARHPNSAIAIIPPTETVLVNGLIKFRAGAHTDDIGINTVKCPFHVPWVWCELALTYANGRLKLYGQGSMFPSHAWYLNGQQVLRQDEVGDATFPKKRHKVTVPIIGRQFERQSWTEIDEKLLRLYPVLSAGAPASEPQVPIGDHKGPVYLHPHTAPRKEGSAHVHP